MTRKRLALILAFALPGCTTIPTAPVEVSDQTVLDEQGMIAVEAAYAAVGLAIETGVDAGLIHGERADRLAAADRAAYAALGKLRAAYRAGNAASYEAALSELQTAISSMIGD